jgi:hypothetical protein
MKIPDVLRVTGDKTTLMFGRALYKEKFQIGKIYAKDGVFEFRLRIENGEISLKSGFEVLSCSSNKEPSCGKFLNFYNKFENEQICAFIPQV